MNPQRRTLLCASSLAAALPLLSAESRKWLPDMNNPKNGLINDLYWADNYDRLTRRFKEWSLS